MAADIKEAIRRMIFRYISEGADKVIATQEAVAASTTQTDKASLSLEKSFGNLERRYVETVRHQQDYQKVQEKVNAAVAQNPALQERANTVLAAASQHYDNLAGRAEKGSLSTKLLGRAFSTLLGPAGLLGLAMTGIGTAVGYMAAQWQSSSTTVEQALSETNRLMAESKKLIDERTSAQDRMFAQSRAVTEFQTTQNLLDLQLKLNKAMEDAARLAERRTTTPSQVPGEMGEAPTGLAPLAAGYDKVADAVARLREAHAAGLPGLAAFNDELARIGQEYPAIAAEINNLIVANQQNGIATEQAVLKQRAMADALAGIATNAQMAAAGLGSIAQFNFENLKAQDAAYALERMANEMDRLATIYPTLSLEGAKQVELLDAQLVIAQARTEQERLIAQEKAKVLQLTLQGVEAEEAALIASKERQIAEANIARAKEEASKREAEASARAAEASERAAEAAAAAGRRARQQTSEQADEQADVSDEVDDTNEGLRQTNVQISRAVASTGTWVHVMSMAEAIAGRLSMFNPMSDLQSQYAGTKYSVNYDPLMAQLQKQNLEKLYGAGNIEAITMPDPTGGNFIAGYRVKQEYLDAQRQAAIPGMIGGMDISTPGAASSSLSQVLALGLQDGLSNVTRVIDAVADPATQANLVQQAINYVLATQPAGLAREEMINTLNSKLQGLISSTDSLNATMQQALSPFYSQDPRTTHLGFRAGVVGNPEWMVPGASNENPLAAILGAGATAPGMAGGGSFMVGGGYSANDNRIAAFPVASGEEVIVNRARKGGEGGQVIHIDNRTIINGRVDADVFAQMKVSKYQQTQRMRAGLAAA